MDFKETQLNFLSEDCMKQFGGEKGEEVYRRTVEIYDSLCEKADFRNDKAIEAHMRENLFPTMAYYKALLAFGYSKDAAIELVKIETAKSAEVKKAKQQKIAKLPCAYFLYKTCVKSAIKKNYPPCGWDTEWVMRNKKIIHFNFTRCLYKDTCDEQGCPELCPVFCANDDIAFSGLMPKIRFERSCTLGKGDGCCDFHFIKNK